MPVVDEGFKAEFSTIDSKVTLLQTCEKMLSIFRIAVTRNNKSA